MSTLFSSSYALPLKVLFLSTTILSAAVAIKVTVPAIADFAVTDAPSIYNGVISWLKPPYLYLVINCIIITIFAASKLQSKFDDSASPPPIIPLPEIKQSPPPVPVQVYRQQTILDPVSQYNYGDFNGQAVESMRSEDFRYVNDNINSEIKYYEPVILSNGVGKELIDSINVDSLPVETEMRDYANEQLVEPKSTLPPPPLIRRDSTEFLDSNEKPLVSARFGHRRSVKASPEGGKTAMSLGVSKSRKQDTLENTWKTITEGRAVPLARHLRKSDTWETHGRCHQIPAAPQAKKMTKADTFQDRTPSTNPLRSPSPGSVKLKKEPSLSQDELNKRVEAFIRKFNEEMRLQRQESLNQYTEMIKRGAHQ